MFKDVTFGVNGGVLLANRPALGVEASREIDPQILGNKVKTSYYVPYLTLKNVILFKFNETELNFHITMSQNFFQD